MINTPTWSLAQLRALKLDTTAILCTPSVRPLIKDLFSFPLIDSLANLPGGVENLIVVGGGSLIDEAKLFRVKERPALSLIAIPSIWGSGAEVSPIAIERTVPKKQFRIDPKLLPDARLIISELAASIPPMRAKHACGDVWAHAVEGFLSPLGSDTLKKEMAAVIAEMTKATSFQTAQWFEWGAKACAGQAASSVGLVHGMAHVLESVLATERPDLKATHARLCATLLYPVMKFNRSASATFQKLMEAHGIDAATVLEIARDLYEPEFFEAILSTITNRWMDILRDPCSRTNCALVRPGDVAFFEGKKFL